MLLECIYETCRWVGATLQEGEKHFINSVGKEDVFLLQCSENKITNANGACSKTVFLLSNEQIISYLKAMVTVSECLTGKLSTLFTFQ